MQSAQALTAPPLNQLARELIEIGAAHPRVRKRLVASEISSAREMIRTLARSGEDTTGWEAANLRSIAEELSALGAAREKKTPANDVRITSLINQAIDDVASDSRKYPALVRHAQGLGFRDALRDSVLELRTMGVPAKRLTRNKTGRELARAAGAVLERYESLLETARLLDVAEIFHLALEDFDTEAPLVLQGVIVIAPGLGSRGLRSALLRRLVDRGAILTSGDLPRGVTVPDRMSERAAKHDGSAPRSLLSYLAAPGEGLASKFPPPANSVDIFAASSPFEEVREVLRRALGEGYRWAEVELVTSDPDTYGIVLDTICERLGVGMTSLRGIPFNRTRIGRCLSRWLNWISNGLPADAIRSALESAELEVPGELQVDTAQLAPLFRSLGIGWGRDRYDGALAQLRDKSAMRRLRLRDDEDEEEDSGRVAAALINCERLEKLLTGLLAITPPVPERGSDTEVLTSAARLASASLRFLEMVRCEDPADLRTLDKLRGCLKDIADVDEPETSFALALASLESGIADLRAWSAVSGSKGVLSAQGGKIFLTDIPNAGFTGRKRTFVLGLDSDSVGGPQLQDPVLLDSDRKAIDPENLATSAERRAEQRYILYKSLASLRGRVTLSYSTTGEDGRERGPSHILLQAVRLAERNPTLGYRELHLKVTPPECAVPKGVTKVIDSRDGWLAALAAKPVIADGSAQTRAAFPGLDAGISAAAGRAGAELCAHHGMVPNAAGKFDPRLTRDRVLSPSSLELLGACPLAWFYKYAAEIAPPSDPEYRPESWLNASDRGSLLHSVFEDFGREYFDKQERVADPEAEEAILRILARHVGIWKSKVPPPNNIVFELEREELERSARSYLTLERNTRRENPAVTWKALEQAFGQEGKEAYFTLADGTAVRIRGRIDRVDGTPEGLLLVIDYKTGRAGKFQKKKNDAPFKGGRQLQAALYAEVAEGLFNEPVARFEYRFPTPRGENTVIRYTRDELKLAQPVVASLLEHVVTGTFLPTSESSDCRYCDYSPICRVKVDDYGKVNSPLAIWAKENQENHAEFVPMRTRRGHND